MRIYCALPFGSEFELQEHFYTERPAAYLPAHMVYRIRGSRLYFASGAANIRNGVMVISSAGYTGGAPVDGLLDDIAYEIKKRGFEGVVLDSGGAPDNASRGGKVSHDNDLSPLQTALAARLVSALQPFPVYLPVRLASVVEGSVALIQTALSGGELERHLSSAIERFDENHIAVEVDRLRMDFTLPAATGIGENITPGHLETLMENSRVFFSDDLYTNYFTYRESGMRHMVLFDDANSMRQKLNLAERRGIKRAFLYYPGVYDIIGELM